MKNIRSFDEKIISCLEKNYNQIEGAMQTFQSAIEKGQKKCAEFRPEIARAKLAEQMRPVLAEALKVFDAQVQDVTGRFATVGSIVATKVQGSQPAAVDPMTAAVKELTTTIKLQQARSELSSMNMQDRQQAFMDACSRGDEETVSAITGGYCPLLPAQLTDLPVAEMKQRKMTAIVGPELMDTFETVDKSRDSLRQSIGKAKAALLEMLNSAGLGANDMQDPAYKNLSVSDKSALIAEVGLPAFQQMIQPL